MFFMLSSTISLTKSFKKYPVANGHVVWFHYPNFCGGATKYTKLCN